MHRVIPRDYQQAAVDGLRDAYRQGYRAPCFVLPTGGGKTVTFIYITQGAVRRGNRVMILVHRDHLVWQTCAELQRWGISHGVIVSGVDELPASPVQVASVQTLARRLDRWGNWPHFLITDEAHHARAATWEKIIAAMPAAKQLGVTATPARLDGKGLGKVFDTLVFGPEMSWLIENGFLARYRYFAPDAVDMGGIRKQAGDFQRTAAESRVNKKGIIGNIVEHYRKALDGAPTIAFGVSVAHAEALTAQFQAAGFRAATLTGDTPPATRTRMLQDLARGALNVLTSCEVISEGTDVPQCYGAILARPTASTTLFLQQVGRALRPKPDGQPAVILDHAGNILRHGFPDAPRTWSLADGLVKDKSESATTTCNMCFAVMAAGKKVCPVCGHDRSAEGTGDIPLERHGELLEVSGIRYSDLFGRPEAEVKKETAARAKTLEQLKAIERLWGYKPGWAEHMMAGKQAARRKHGGRSFRFGQGGREMAPEETDTPW